MPSSNPAHAPAAPTASRSIRSFLHLSAGNMQAGSGSAVAALRPSANVNRLTDEFLRSVSGVGSVHGADADTGISGSLDEDVVAKMLSDGARSRHAHLHRISLSATNSHSLSRARTGPIPPGSGSNGSPRSSERRSRAAAGSQSNKESPSPSAVAAASSDQAQRWPQHQKANKEPQLPQQSLQQAQLRPASSAAGSSPHVPRPPSTYMGDSSSLSNAAESDNACAAQNVPGDTLAVLAVLDDIREQKAHALESSLGRESVRRVAAEFDVLLLLLMRAVGSLCCFGRC